MSKAIFDQETAEATLAKELGIPARLVCVVGSTLICGEGNDVDFLCLLPSEEILEQHGFAPDIDAQYESPLRSFRRQDQNVIAVTDAAFFFAEVAIAHAAQSVARDTYDMRDRDERVRFHSEIRFEVLRRMADEEEPA